MEFADDTHAVIPERFAITVQTSNAQASPLDISGLIAEPGALPMVGARAFVMDAAPTTDTLPAGYRTDVDYVVAPNPNESNELWLYQQQTEV